MYFLLILVVVDRIYRKSFCNQTSRIQSQRRVRYLSLSLSSSLALRTLTRLVEWFSAMIVNSNDRVIRLISLSPFPPAPPSPPSPSSDDDEEMQEPEPYEPPPPRPARIPYFEIVHKFQDLVNRTPWNGCGFSSDGEHIMGGTSYLSISSFGE